VAKYLAFVGVPTIRILLLGESFGTLMELYSVVRELCVF